MSCGTRLEPSTTWFSLCWRTACFFLGVAVESNVMSRQAGDVLHQKIASIFQSLRCCQHASRSVGYLTPRFFSSNKCLWCSEVSSSKERRMRSPRWRSNVIITLEFRMKEMLQDGFLTTELIGRNFLDLTIDTCLYIKAAHTRAGGVGRERRGEGEERGGRGGRRSSGEQSWRGRIPKQKFPKIGQNFSEWAKFLGLSENEKPVSSNQDSNVLVIISYKVRLDINLFEH